MGHVGSEFLRSQERLKPQEEKQQEHRSKVDDLRDTPMSVGTLEEIISGHHAIVSTSVGSEHLLALCHLLIKNPCVVTNRVGIFYS